MNTTDPQDPDELLPVVKCADALNVSARTMENVIASGDIPVVRIARRVRRIRRSDLDSYIARATTTAIPISTPEKPA